jgi:peptidoglycan hydrolase CwlO-like protein
MIRQKVIDNYRDMVASLKTELKLAEAEVERLKQMVKSITGELDEVIETNQYLDAELAKYKRAYAEICHQYNFGNESDYIAMYNYWLDWAEKEGE